MYRKTTQAAREVPMPLTHLQSLIRAGKINPLPERDGSGHFIWTDSDIDRVRAVLQQPPRKPQNKDSKAGR